MNAVSLCKGILLGVIVTCVAAWAGAAEKPRGGGKMGIVVSSAAFDEGGLIPSRYTCDGENVSPPIQLTGVPAEAKRIAMICDDPDAPAGTWVHWVVYDLPPEIAGLPEAVPPDRTVLGGAKQGLNDFRKIGYGGPCPPGGTHRYFFKVYALDTATNLAPGARKGDLLKAMEGHVIAHGELMGKYHR